MTIVRNEKDFWTGLIYIVFGAAIMRIALDYPFGTAGRMGPGYFPRVLAGVQILLGLIAVGRSFVVPGGACPISRMESDGAGSWSDHSLWISDTYRGPDHRVARPRTDQRRSQ